MSTAYSVAEAFGRPADVNDGFRDAPVFYCAYGGSALLAVGLVLIPRAPW